MTNFDLHERAQQLADNESAYQLARRLIEMEQDRDQLRGCFHTACEELTALKTALVDEGEEVPTGPALSLVERLKAERDALAEQAPHGMGREEREAAWAALRMVRDAIGELFGPTASIESDEAVLLRGPEYHHEAEAQIAALKRVSDDANALTAQLKQLIAAVRKWEGLSVTAGSKAAELVESALKIALEPIDTSLAHHDADVIASMSFPTMLRRMWSGGDVQQWLREQAEERRRQAEGEKLMIYPMSVERNQDGWWSHPAFDEMAGDREALPMSEVQDWLDLHRLEMRTVLLDEYEIDGDPPALEDWELEPPGNEWFLLAVGDSEDGLFQHWARHKTPLDAIAAEPRCQAEEERSS